MKNVDYSAFDLSPTKEQIMKTKQGLYAKLTDDTEPLVTDDKELLTATRVRLFAESNGYGFFASVVRPVPYDFILETAYAHTFTRPSILYGFIILIDGGWLEIGQYENKEVLPPAPDVDTIITGLLNPEVDPSILPGAVYFRLYPGCALPAIEIIASEDFELLLEHRNSQKHKLEGDFSTYFSVYADTLSTDQVREVLTPDVMAILIDEYAGTSIEFSEKGLFILNTKLSLSDSSQVQEVLDHASRLIDKLLYQIMDTAKFDKPKQLPKSSDKYISADVIPPFTMWSIAKFLIALAIGGAIVGTMILFDRLMNSIKF